MRPNRPRPARLAALLLLLLLVGGCGGAGPQATAPATPTASPGPSATATPAEVVRLTMTCRCVRGDLNSNLVVWFEDSVAPAFEEMLAAEGQPVEIELIPFSDTDEALRDDYRETLAHGEGPDLLVMDGFWIPEFVESGYLEPLDEVAGPEVTAWEGWAHISPGVADLMSYQGEVYGIALGTDTRALFYRRDLFEKAGIPTPWQPRSWEDILETARTLKAQLPGVTPLQINAGTAMGEATTMQGYAMLLLGAGGHFYDFAQQKWVVRSPAILESLRLYETLYGPEALGEATLQLEEGGRDRSFAAFRDGELAMLIESDYLWRSVLAPGSDHALPERNELVAWTRMPALRPGAGYNGQSFVTISGGTGTVLNPNSPHPELAWRLLSFMFSYEMMSSFQLIEPRMRVRNDVAVPGEPLLTEMARELLPLTTVRPPLPEYPRVSEAAQRMTERVVRGEMSPEEAMEEYAQSVEALVGEENTLSLP